MIEIDSRIAGRTIMTPIKCIDASIVYRHNVPKGKLTLDNGWSAVFEFLMLNKVKTHN
ncbi:hypothetical protein [Congzhengia minquanensis]|jgi:hypothetical protein|uniref:Uncharacterized protein n=1 Tax=Congzhengia minquanensis TaxID=2763657 RepID=A0A926DM25_9FIRM|nr:hypothetical protein [Congzhengia minquanensis]MBC8540781.1 hypothetical protein [Congzhengia minquanensis]